MKTPRVQSAVTAGALVFTLAAILPAVGCGRQAAQKAPPALDEPALWLAQGAATVKPFKQNLLVTLQAAIQAHGPEVAVRTCQLQAPAIAGTATGPQVEVGRTSHRLRNPDNAPRVWVKPLLDSYVAAAGADTLPRTVELEDGGVGYVEPIMVKPLCVTCHGAQVAPALAKKIHELYPQDQATGFAVGDFRGLFWVEFSKAWRDSVHEAATHASGTGAGA
jgi:hypothetical protein